MGDSFLAPLNAIEDHTRYVEGLRDKARTADDAAGQVRTQTFDLAFGVLCQSFPTAIKPVEEQTVDTIDRIVDALQHTTDNLKETTKSYRDLEESIKSGFEKALEELGIDLDTDEAKPIDPMPRVPGNGNAVPMPEVNTDNDGTVYV